MRAAYISFHRNVISKTYVNVTGVTKLMRAFLPDGVAGLTLSLSMYENGRLGIVARPKVPSVFVNESGSLSLSNAVAAAPDGLN